MRAADFSWEAPPSPVKTTISSSAIIALQLRHKRHSVPPKESNACFLKIVRGCLPQSLHSPQFPSLTRFTLIYPSCSVPSLATTVPTKVSGTRRLGRSVLLGFRFRNQELMRQNWSNSYSFHTNLTVQTNDNRSLKRSAKSTNGWPRRGPPLQKRDGNYWNVDRFVGALSVTAGG